MIHLIQYLCPSRHCIAGIAYNPTDLPEEDAMAGFRQLVDEAVARHELNPWCGLCGSHELKYEDAITTFRTLEEARPVIEQLQAEQMATRKLFGRF